MNAGTTTSELSENEAEVVTLLLVRDLAPIGNITHAPRLHGFAIFEDGVMFGFVEADGTPYLRAGLRAAERFNALGSSKHPEMPYWSIPKALSSNIVVLREIAYESADNAHLAASFGIDDLTLPAQSAQRPLRFTSALMLLAA